MWCFGPKTHTVRLYRVRHSVYRGQPRFFWTCQAAKGWADSQDGWYVWEMVEIPAEELDQAPAPVTVNTPGKDYKVVRRNVGSSNTRPSATADKRKS